MRTATNVCARVRSGRSQPRSGARGGDRACHVVPLFLPRHRVTVVPKGREAFSYHKKSGFLALVGVVIVLGVIEIVVVHLLVSRFSVVAAVALSQYRLAKETGVPAQRIGQIVLGRRRITVDTDLRLCRFFGLSDGYWLRAQAAYDLEANSEEHRL